MAWVDLGVAAIGAAGAIGSSAISKGGKKGGGNSSQAAQFQPSPYHTEASDNINNFYTSRIKGQNLGYSQDTLDTMDATAIDSSNYLTNEAVRRGSSARKTPGGVYTGGMNTLREGAVNTGLQTRSSALRDVATQNAVLSHQDQWNAATGLQNFLAEQDQYALGVYNAQTGNQNANNQMQWLQNMYSTQQSNQSSTDWTKLALQAAQTIGNQKTIA